MMRLNARLMNRSISSSLLEAHQFHAGLGKQFLQALAIHLHALQALHVGHHLLLADLGTAGHTHVGEVGLQRPFQLADLVHIAGADDAERDPRATGTARTTAAVGVVLRLAGQVEVEHVGHVLHIDAARSHVGGDQQADAPGPVTAHHMVALCLAQVPVDGIGVVAITHQGGGEVLGLVLGAAEHDAEQVGVRIHETLQGRVTVLGMDHTVLVLDGGWALFAGPTLTSSNSRM
jgi:hypothetical protein